MIESAAGAERRADAFTNRVMMSNCRRPHLPSVEAMTKTPSAIKNPPAPEQAGGPAAEEQEAAVAEDVRAHDPLEGARRHVEVLADRGERDADHRHIKRIEKQGAAKYEQRAPGGGAELVGEGSRCTDGHAVTPFATV
jgi:hypothetical protein